MDVNEAVRLIRDPKDLSHTQSPARQAIVVHGEHCARYHQDFFRRIADDRRDQYRLCPPERFWCNGERGPEKALQERLAEKPSALVFDLRQDPGGYLDAAIDVASQFLKQAR